MWSGDAQKQETLLARLLGQYKALGIEPVWAGGILVSPALLQNLGRLPSKGAVQEG